MIAFWLIAGLAAAVSGILVLAFAARARGAAPDIEREATARQFAELAALRDRGLLDEPNWAAARAEAARRLLARAGPPAEAVVARPADRLWTLGGILLTAAAALGVYLATGSPGAPDQPYAARVEAWSENLEQLDPQQLAAVAEQVARERSGEPQAWIFLGRARFEAGDGLGSASAFRRALALDAEDPQIWAWLGEALTRAQDGVVGLDAQAAFDQALARDPSQRTARYYLGRLALEQGDRAGALRLWGPLLEAFPADDPRRIELEQSLSGSAAP